MGRVIPSLFFCNNEPYRSGAFADLECPLHIRLPCCGGARFFDNYGRWSAPPPSNGRFLIFCVLNGRLGQPPTRLVVWCGHVGVIGHKRPSSSFLFAPRVFKILLLHYNWDYCCRLFVSMARTAGRTGSFSFLFSFILLFFFFVLFRKEINGEAGQQSPATRDSLWPQRTEHNYTGPCSRNAMRSLQHQPLRHNELMTVEDYSFLI